MKLLVVDDQESVGVIVSEIARHGGWETTHSSNALEAVALVGKYKPDVLMIDQMMPGMQGTEVIAQLRAKGSKMPVILFTGDSASITPAEAEKLGITKVLYKPVSIKDLRALLTEISLTL